MVKNHVPLPACHCRKHKKRDLIPGPGRSRGGGHGNPLQCSCLENPPGKGAWWAMVHRVAKRWSLRTNLACMNACSLG